jgi:hypothetical protein
MTEPMSVEEARARVGWAFASWYERDETSIAYAGGFQALANAPNLALDALIESVRREERACMWCRYGDAECPEGHALGRCPVHGRAEAPGG